MKLKFFATEKLGIKSYYPDCEKSALLSSMHRRRTFGTFDIQNLERIGFEIETQDSTESELRKKRREAQEQDKKDKFDSEQVDLTMPKPVKKNTSKSWNAPLDPPAGYLGSIGFNHDKEPTKE